MGSTHQGTHGQQYTDEQVVAALRRAAVSEGSPLTADRYDAYEAEHGGPSSIRIIQRFETWNAACAAAGLAVNQSHGSYRRNWTPAEMLEHVADYLALGGSRSIAGYGKYAAVTEGAPSPQTVRNAFGGKWSIAKAQAEEMLAAREGS